MVLVCCAVGPVNSCKNIKSVDAILSEAHLWLYERFLTVAKYHSYQIVPFQGAKGRASIAVRNYVNLNPEICFHLF
jgi:hypothetical protein